MGEWLKLLVGTMCILNILLHLLPQGKFTGYVRFYAGMLFFLVAIGPVLNVFFGEGELERLLKLEFLKTEYYDADTSVQAMADLKNTTILAAYRKELERQVTELSLAYGIEVKNAQLFYDAEEEYQLTGVTLTVTEETYDADKAGQVQAEIADLFALSKDAVHMIDPAARLSGKQ